MSLDTVQPFNPDSEDDLRFALALYFRELGFDRDELSFEDQFQIQLGRNTQVLRRGEELQRDRLTGRSDLLLTRHGESIAIVETKARDHDLTEDDAWQAISYASLVRPIAPYAIVTNGFETRAYDTWASITRGDLTSVEDPRESRWYGDGEQIPSVDQDLRFHAARILIGVNPLTLESFCREQVTYAMEDLRGTPREGRIYVPDVYVSRPVVDRFDDWLSTDLPCFAVVGESGIGKSNFMCATAEGLLGDAFVLFYRATRFTEGLVSAICNDFVWEFDRNRGIAYIVERFDRIASEYDQEFVIFLDGLDEFPGDRSRFKAELLDFVHRLRGRSIRLCVSCKSFDWPHFVLDRGYTYNRLARLTYPARDSVHDPPSSHSPDARQVGVWLSEFTDDELDAVYPRYEEAFSLRGDLRGSTRTDCQNPLMLRFIAEVYRDRNVALPSQITSRELFDRYWNRRLAETEHRVCAEQVLTQLARLSIETGERQVYESDLREHLDWSTGMSEAYGDLLRLGLMADSVDDNGYRRLAFGFEKMRSYTYAVQAQRWPARDSESVATAISQSLTNLLGVEAVEFYLTTIDRGETRALTELALRHFDQFVQLAGSVEPRSSIAEDAPGDQRQTALWNRLEQYATAYSQISREHFPGLCERIAPYTNADVGIWVHGSMYQHRGRTDSYPQPVLVLSDEVAEMAWTGDFAPQVYAALRPGGTKYIGMRDMVRQIPQFLAWNRIEAQVGGLFCDRLLDESTSPGLLQERIWEMLLYEPSWWVHECTRPRATFLELLAFENVEGLEAVTIGDLLTRVYSLYQEYHREISQSNGPPDPGSYSFWCLHRCKQLRRLYYWLEMLNPLCEHLQRLRFSLDEVFDYLRVHDLEPVLTVLESLVPDILGSYRSMAESNFSELIDRLPFYTHPDASLLVEVTQNPLGGTSDFLNVGYILLPSFGLPEGYLVYTCAGEESVAHIPLVRQTLRGTATAHGAGFGEAPISRQIGDIHVEESNAFICFSRFPSRHPVLDQVYQLLGHEVRYVLRADSHEWMQLKYGHPKRDKLDWWINREWALRRLRSTSSA